MPCWGHLWDTLQGNEVFILPFLLFSGDLAKIIFIYLFRYGWKAEQKDKQGQYAQIVRFFCAFCTNL